MSNTLPTLQRAIADLGETNTERAERLKVTPRMVAWYLDGEHVPSVKTLKKAAIPELIDALIIDLLAIHEEMLAAETPA